MWHDSSVSTKAVPARSPVNAIPYKNALPSFNPGMSCSTALERYIENDAKRIIDNARVTIPLTNNKGPAIRAGRIIPFMDEFTLLTLLWTI